MKRLLALIIGTSIFVSCNEKEDKGKFTVNGEIKNIVDQKVYLEELFFSQKDPEVLDTAEIHKGKFTLSALAPEQGLYRIRLEKESNGFIFINDKPVIPFYAVADDLNGNATNFATSANVALKGFIGELSGRATTVSDYTTKLNDSKRIKDNDSAVQADTKSYDSTLTRYKNYIVRFIDTTSYPVTALFALGYIRDIEPDSLEKPVAKLKSRFSGHQAVAMVAEQFKAMLAQTRALREQKDKVPHEGIMAPNFTLNDADDKPFSLSDLKGKYVLVDFWASWCGPCRQENPNIVAAYNKYKSKNFTVLGVSLDNDKTSWLNAIARDKLAWKQISDLKQWESAVVPLYGFEAIPYNVLLDPQGKIIATSLIGEQLESTLASILK